MSWLLKVGLSASIIVGAFISGRFVYFNMYVPKMHYDEGQEYLTEGNYNLARQELGLASSYNDARKLLQMWENDILPGAGIAYRGVESSLYYIEGHQVIDEWKDEDIVSNAFGENNVVAAKEDGTVLVNGHFETSEVKNWTNMIAVRAEDLLAAGLKSDGTVEIVPDSDFSGILYRGEEFVHVGDWIDIVQIEVGRFHIVGLKGDGTVIVDGNHSIYEGKITAK